jgi:hypothetical protein
MDRRQFVKLAGMASIVATGGLAGCQDGGNGDGDGTEDGTPDNDDGTGGGTTARYNDWVYADANADREMFAVSLDWQSIPDMDDGQATPQENEALQNDVLATTPVSFLFVGALSVGFGLAQTGVDSVVQEEGDGPTEFVHVASGGIVLEGSYDEESLAQSVEEAGATEVEEYNGYTLYENDTSGAVIGLSSDTIITVQRSSDGVSDPLARTKGLADAGAGDKTPLSLNVAAFADLMTALPNRAIMGTSYSSEARPLNSTPDSGEGDRTGFSQTNLDGNINGIASSASLSEESMTSSLAIRYESESEVNDRAALEAAIGTEASDRSVTIDGSLVVIEGTYSTVPNPNA